MDIGTYDHITSFFERVWADVLLITCQEFAQAFGILAKGCHKMTKGILETHQLAAVGASNKFYCRL